MRSSFEPFDCGILRRAVRATLIFALVGGCSDGTGPLPPVASITVMRADVAILKGGSHTLSAITLDSAGNAVAAAVTWTSRDVTIATVSSAGVVSAVGYGTTTIRATADTKSASAEIVVTEPPTGGAYSVLELPGAAEYAGIYTQLNDSGDVLAGQLYRRGIPIAIPDCFPVALNDLRHVLCLRGNFSSFNRYTLWRDGVATPLAAVDTFQAVGFSAVALNDSGVVAGLYFQPAFNNSNCLGSVGGRCAVLWKNGQPTFPGLYVYSGMEYVAHLNDRLDLVLQDIGFAPNATGGSPFLYNAASKERRAITQFVRAINDQGWMAVERMYVIRGPSTFVETAIMARADTSIIIGPGAATGINNAGTVVGTLKVGSFLWKPGRGVSLLAKAANDPSWTITSALRINNRGQILAQANHADGRQGLWVVLTPTVP